MTIFLITWFAFFLYSFTREDLNLVLYRFFPPILKNIGYYQRPLATLIFVFLSLIFIFTYLNKIHQKLPLKFSWLKWALSLVILGILAYPMFSYDIFNYLFNAKMILIYKANPHLRSAIEFSDPVLRFMQNTHTPAPYAYGWTLASLVPGLVWFTQKFTLLFWAMKAFIALFWLGELSLLKKLVQKLFPQEPYRWWLFALSPLVLVETLINGHNDVVMMLPALFSFWILLKSKRMFDKPHVLSLLMLIVSTSIKYATIVLLPLYILKNKLKNLDIPAISSLLLLAIMFTRPGQLHSWYLIWGFSFAVLSKSRWLISFFVALTLGALLRYAPYIYYGNWDPPVYLLRNLIWGGSLLLTPILHRLLPISPKNRPVLDNK